MNWNEGHGKQTPKLQKLRYLSQFCDHIFSFWVSFTLSIFFTHTKQCRCIYIRLLLCFWGSENLLHDCKVKLDFVVRKETLAPSFPVKFKDKGSRGNFINASIVHIIKLLLCSFTNSFIYSLLSNFTALNPLRTFLLVHVLFHLIKWNDCGIHFYNSCIQGSKPIWLLLLVKPVDKSHVESI